MAPAARAASTLPPPEGIVGGPAPRTPPTQRRSRAALSRIPFSTILLEIKRYPTQPNTLRRMAETRRDEGMAARLAEIRGQLKLLSDYL
jgi:hypothetical protein